jgi:hypothetical protein
MSSVATQQLPPLLGEHVEASSALAREHTHHARLVGRVVDAANAPVAGARVFVYGYQPFYWALPIGSAVTDGNGRYECAVDGVGRARVWAVSPPDRPFCVADMPMSPCSGRTSELRPITLDVPAGDAKPPTIVRGRLLAADGAPIPGAFVRLQHVKALDPAAFARTGADGAFAIATGLGTPHSATIFFGGCRVELEHTAGQREPEQGGRTWRVDMETEIVLRSDDFVAFPLAATGADDVRFATWLGGSTEPCRALHVHTIKSDHSEGYVQVVATAPGRVPRVQALPQGKFDFGEDRPRTLRVVDDAGDPIVGALVDLCSEGQRFEESTLETVKTAAEGRVRLMAPADLERVVYAYADGHDPARGVWLGGDELQLVLVRRTGRLVLDVRDGTNSIHVRRAGVFDPAAIAYPATGELSIDLAPGAYEVTCYGTEKPVVAAERVVITASETTKTPLAADRRPTVRVRVPAKVAGDGAWWAFASRETWGGMISKWRIHTTRGGPMPRRALVAEVEELANAGGADRDFLLRLPISGRHTLLLGTPGGERLFREVVVDFGGSYAIDVPAGQAPLRATVAAYPEFWVDGAHHGIAGPRLCLEPEGDTAFGVMVPLPEPAQFTTHVPAPGRYTVHHHLYETGMRWNADGTSGGREIEVGTTPIDLGAIERGMASALEVRVRDRDGKDVNGVLSVRDRMFEAWTHDLQQNTTLDGAMDAIPEPPSARLRDGAATLGRVRAGRLSFRLDVDDGRRVFFSRTVDPSRRLEVELPAFAR